MDFHEVIRFATENPACFLSTAEDDQPRVRTVMLMRADERGFCFETVATKDLSRQLHKNPKIEVCFYNSPVNIMDAAHIRISGEATFVKDQETVDEIYEKVRPLAEHAGIDMRPNFEVFCLKAGEAHFWSMDDFGRKPRTEKIIF